MVSGQPKATQPHLKTAIVLPKATLSGALTVAHIKPLSSLGNKTINFFYRVSVFPSLSLCLFLPLLVSNFIQYHFEFRMKSMPKNN